jgi:hypothetical protein
MKRLVFFVALTGLVLLSAALPVGAHEVQTPEGCVSLSPGHFAAAGGHESAIDHSGGTVDFCEFGPVLNPNAPPENPG